jgi:hypothetical protein
MGEKKAARRRLPREKTPRIKEEETNQVHVEEKQEGSKAIGIAILVLGILGFFISISISPILAIALLLGAIAGLLVHRDAYDREDPSAAAWAFGTFLLLIIVLPIYLYHRAYGPHPLGKRGALWQRVETESKAARTPKLKLGKHCAFCNRFMVATDAFCPSCGKAQK